MADPTGIFGCEAPWKDRSGTSKRRARGTCPPIDFTAYAKNLEKYQLSWYLDIHNHLVCVLLCIYLHARNRLKQKRKKLRVGLSHSLAFLKQQVVIGFRCNTSLSARIRVQTPSILLPFLNCFTDILMVTNLHTFPFFQLIFTFLAL